MPNLFSSNPVVIYLWVFASTLGFILNETGAFLFNFAAMFCITLSSAIDSQLKLKIS